MILDIFLSNKYDNKIAITDGKKSYTFFELKKIIAYETELLKNKKETVAVVSKDNFLFFIHFFASIFSDKKIYLIADKTRLNDLNADFDILDDCNLNYIENYTFSEIDIKKPLINFYTSGSSGTPKIICKSLYNLIREAEDIGEEFNLKNKNLSVLSTTTMCHLFGLTFHLMVPLVNGFIINTQNVSYPENIDKNNAVLVSTPTFLSSTLKHNLQFKITPEYIISAGSKLDNDIFEYLEKKSRIIEIYGSTETGVIAHKTHFNSDFTVFKNVKVNVNAENAEVVSDYLYGKNAIINDSLEITGNLLKIKNRTDRLVKICEKRISIDEIENKLKTNKFIEDCYIFKFNDKLASISVLSKEGQDFLLKNDIIQLIKLLKKNLLQYYEIIPQKWRFIDEIPMTQSGKVNKKLIEHIFSVNLSLPVILDRTVNNNEINYKILFYRQCNFFNGHFPKFEIVPGVVQLYLAKEFANAHFNLSLGAGQWKRIKFSNIIKPDSIVDLKIEKNDKLVSYEYYSNEKKYSSGAFLCENIFDKAFGT